MAAEKTPTVIRETLGSCTLHIATFTDIDDGDYWTSQIQGIIGYWGNLTDDGTQTKEGIDMVLTTASTGLLTFYTGEDNRAGLVFVLSKS
jgi:hypothetical protein